jgi:hypothetical protein
VAAVPPQPSPRDDVIYTEVTEKLLRWVGDTPFATVSINQLEALIERPRVRRRPEHVKG